MDIVAKIKGKLGGESGKFAGDLGFKTITEIANAVFGILTFAILSRLLTNTADYTVVNQVIAVSSLIAPVILIKMNNSFCLFLAGEQDRGVIKSRFFSVLLLTLPLCAAVIAVMWGFDGWFSQLMFDAVAYKGAMPQTAYYCVALSLSMLTQALYQATGKQKKANSFIILRVALTTVVFLGLSFFPTAFTLTNVLYLYNGVETVVFLAAFGCLLWDYRDVKCTLAFQPLKEYYRYALPLMPFTIMSWINSFIGRFILNHLAGLEVSADYSFYSALISRAFFINAVIVFTIFPYISKFWNEGNKEQVTVYLRKAANVGMFFALPITFGVAAVMPTITELLSGGNYAPDRWLTLWLCWANIFQMLYSAYAFLIDLSRRTVLYNVIFLLSSLLNIGLNYLLIPVWGIYGAAIAMLIAYAVQFVMTLFIGTRAAKLKISIDWLFMARSTVCALLMYAVCRPLYGEGGWVRFFLTVIVGCTVYFVSSWGLAKLTKKPLL